MKKYINVIGEHFSVNSLDICPFDLNFFLVSIYCFLIIYLMIFCVDMLLFPIPKQKFGLIEKRRYICIQLYNLFIISCDQKHGNSG